MKPGTASQAIALLLLALFVGCKGDSGPTAPLMPIPTPVPGSLAGTWTGLITYVAGELSPIGGPCSSSEAITVSVTESGDGQVMATFSSGCYTGATFTGRASTSTLNGQMLIEQHICNEEGGYVAAQGQSSGSFDATHIHLETPDLGTADCSFGVNAIDFHRSH